MTMNQIMFGMILGMLTRMEILLILKMHLVTIKNRLAGQDGLIPKMINAAEFQLM